MTNQFVDNDTLLIGYGASMIIDIDWLLFDWSSGQVQVAVLNNGNQQWDNTFHTGFHGVYQFALNLDSPDIAFEH